MESDWQSGNPKVSGVYKRDFIKDDLRFAYFSTETNRWYLAEATIEKAKENFLDNNPSMTQTGRFWKGLL